VTGTSHPDNDHGRWSVYFGASGWTVLDEHGAALILTRSDNADREVRAVVDARNTLAAEVRRLREQAANDTRAVECPHVRGDTSKWCDLAETEVSRLREEVDTLRADQAPGQEGHQRVCVPLVAERDALRREIRHFIAEARQLAHQIKQPDTFCGNDAEVWRLLFLLGGDRP